MVEILDRPVCGSDGGRFATPMDEEATILLKTIQAMLQTVGYTLVAEPDASFIERFGVEGL